MTLAVAAAKSGYSKPTINGLELRGEGSQRLKDRLRQIYTLAPTDADSVKRGHSDSVKSPVAMMDEATEYLTCEQWRDKALAAERKLEAIRTIIELSSDPSAQARAVVHRIVAEHAESSPAAPSAKPIPKKPPTP